MGQKGKKGFSQMYKIGNIVIISLTLYSYKIAVLSSLFTPIDVSKCEIRCQLVQEHYISRLQTSFISLVNSLYGTAKTKLTILAFLYCGEFLKNSKVTIRYLFI